MTGRLLTHRTAPPEDTEPPAIALDRVTTPRPSAGAGTATETASERAAVARTVVCSVRSPRVTWTVTGPAGGGEAAASRWAGDWKRRATTHVPAAISAAPARSAAHGRRRRTGFTGFRPLP